jgi:hypothetical protein
MRISTGQKMEAAKSLAADMSIPVKRALKYVYQFNYVSLIHLLRVVDTDPEDFKRWFKQQRKLKKLEWDIRPKIQSQIASRQNKAKIVSALSG